MRITFIVAGLETSGGARIIAGHARRLAEKGHEVLIVAPKRPRISIKRRVKALLGRDTLPHSSAASHYSRTSLRIRIADSSKLVSAEDVPDADVVVATFWTTAEWVSMLPPSKGVKTHFIQHYEAFPEWPAFRDRVEAVWRLPTYKIAIAEWLVKLGREKFGIDKIALVPNSVDHELFSSQQRTRTVNDRPTVGFLFHNASFKDVRSSIRAAEALRQMIPQVRLVSFGGDRPRANELPTGTEFYHLPSQEQIAKIYKRCDAWLSTSTTEGFNLPPLEAMASGCPVVCTKTGRPLEIIENGKNGYLVDQGDVQGFAGALAKILTLNPGEWQAMSAAAMQAVAHPTWEESSSLFEKALFESLGTALNN